MDIGGRGGQSLSYTNVLNKVFLGGGGGGGQQNNLQATPGTNGGGIVIIRANSITGNGFTINASAFAVLTGGCDGTGGGGGGGSILLDVAAFNGPLNVNAKGGDGAFPTCYLQGASGGGGGGCVWSKMPLPVNVSFNVNKGIRGIHGGGSQDGTPGDTLSGLTVIGTPFTFVPFSVIASSQNDSVCFGNSTTLAVTPNGTGYSYSWSPSFSLSDATINNPVATPVSNTTYSIILTYPSGCKASDSTTVIVKPKPVAAYSATLVCNSNATVFTDSSTSVSGTIINQFWDFGDGSPVIDTPNPSHLYSTAGSYNVTLIAVNSFGCADTITKPVSVYFNPLASFTSANVCFGDTLYFTNTSSVDTSSSIATYLWVFGDSSATGNVENPAHYYAAPGTYTVTLVVTTTNGCTAVTSAAVSSFDPPSTSFTFNTTCLLDSAVFTNTTTDPTMGSTAGFTWDFGDGSPPDTVSPDLAHLYASPGDYQVTLITYSSNLGCADTLQDTIAVFPMPVADFSFTDVCLNQAMNFNDLSAVSSGNVTSVSWNFGDGSSVVSGANPVHTYPNPGTYIVTLIATTNTSCINQVTKNVIVHPLPDAQYSAPNSCDGSIIQFIDLSTIPATDTIQSQAWNFGDGSAVDNNQNASHVYAGSGSYTVQLLVVSNFGCSDSTDKTIIIHPNPVVLFTTNDTLGCEPLCIDFQNLSSVSSGANVTMAWDFGEGNIASDPTHCYMNSSVFSPAFFNVTLTVTTDSGCISSLSKNNYITVYPNPEAGFTVQPLTATIVNPVISILDISAGADFWTWDFGDADTSSAFNPNPHIYTDTGTYIITLITENQYNCVDTSYQTIVIVPDFLFYIPNAFTPDDDGINDTFAGKGIFISNFEMMIFDRWGNLVFFSDNINKPWDGKVKQGNEIAQGDVYVYSIKITDFNFTKHNFKGIVTLVR